MATLVEQGTPEAEARKKVRGLIPTKPRIQKALNQARGDTRTGADGVCPWWHEVNTYCFQSAFKDADVAWRNWLDSLAGKRAGRRVGYPRFKKKGRARDSFRLYHDVKAPGIRLSGYRRLRLSRIGEVRLHNSAKRLARLINHGYAQVQSVTVSRRGHRWYASVVCAVVVDMPDRPTRKQRVNGTVGVDLGVKVLAALSKPLNPGDTASRFVANPRHMRTAEARMTKAQRALSRTQKGSARRGKAARRVGRLHHEIAARRDGTLHQITKALSTRFSTVAVEDLNVAGMTRSARGTIEAPGRKVRQKAGLNRSILDTAPGALRRQLSYKTRWYGSRLAVLDRWWPSSKTCSDCGWQNPRLTLSDRVFHCTDCGMTMDRDLNAARNIERHATPVDQHVACDTRETENARGVPVRPVALRGNRQGAAKREDIQPPGRVPPQRSDPLALPTPRHGQATLF